MMILTLQILNCAQVSATDPSRCTQCNCAYDLSADGRTCNPKPPGNNESCKSILYCYQCDPANLYHCAKCGDQFKPTNDGCLCEPIDTNCIQRDTIQKKCTKCNFGYGELDGMCTACSKGCANCSFTRISNLVTETCISCCVAGQKFTFSPIENITYSYICPADANYTLLSSKCANCADQTQFGDGCLNCQQNKCTLCRGPSQFINSLGKCEQCGQYCLNCSINGCIKCQSQIGLLPIFNQSGKCFTCNDSSKYGEQCSTCSLTACLSCNRTGYSVINGKCQQCPDHCKNCYRTDQCATCNDGYYNNAGACRDCSKSIYGQACAECDSTKCLKCQSTINQTVINGKCTYCQQGCLSCNGNDCLSCVSGLYLNPIAKKCYNCSIQSMYGNFCQQCDATVCNSCLYSNHTIVNGKCQACPALCSTCNASQCLSCQNSRVSLYNGSCYDCKLSSQYGNYCSTCNDAKCISCTSYSSVGLLANKCVSCPQFCQTCDDTGCSKCQSQSYIVLLNKTCVNCHNFGSYCSNCSADRCITCNQPRYGINASGHCVQCPLNCANCSEGKCVVCDVGYKEQNGICQRCPANCTECTQSACTNCIANYSIINGQCKTCKDVFGDLCSSCNITDCLSCNNEGNQVSLDQGRCHNCSLYQSCQTCNASRCKTCQNGSYMIGATCQMCTPNCVICASGSMCQTCATGYHLDGGQCYDCNQSKYGIKCQECNSQNCTKCLETTPVLSLVGGKCIECSDKCLECNLDGCLLCQNQDHGISLFDGTCYNCNNAQYGYRCLQCTDTYCYKCRDSDNYNVYNGKCVTCPAYCTKCENNICTACQDDFYVHNGTCQTCPQIFGSPCEICNSSKCSKCKDIDEGVSMAPNSSCIECKQFHTHCLKCNTTGCTECPSGYRIENSTCIRCPDQCVACKGNICIWPPTSGGGGSSGGGIGGGGSGGGSIIIFPCLSKDYFLINGTCRKCSSVFGSECYNCSDTKCHACNSDVHETHSVAADGICYDCTTKEKYGDYCTECNASKCQKCREGNYYLSTDGKCHMCGAYCKKCTHLGCTECDVNDSTMYLHNMSCQPCPPGCETCTSVSQCTSCINSDYYLNKTCHLCTKLSNCQNCTVDGKCTVCLDEGQGVSLVDGKCLACTIKYGEQCSACNTTHCTKCPDNYYVDSTGTCQQCAAECEVCHTVNSSEYCTQCVNENIGTSAVNGVCTSCTAKYGEYCMQCSDRSCTSCNRSDYSIYPDGQCRQCPDYCLRCNGENCTRCIAGNYSLISSNPSYCKACSDWGNCLQCNAYKCLLCARSDYFVDTDGHCKPCSSNCKTCINESTTCLSCYNQNTGVSLIDNTCFNCQSHFQYCNTCNRATCLTCKGENYYINPAGSCIQCQTNCKTCEASGCSQCYNQSNGVSLYNKVCYDCSSSTYGSGCLTCDSSKCLSCRYSNYFINNANECQQCPSLCETCNAQVGCTTCALNGNGVSLYEGRCHNCSVFGDCKDCTSNTCLHCRQSNQYIDASGVCQKCPSLCTKCDGPQQCTACIRSAVGEVSLYDGECHLCSSNCLECQSSLVCTSCRYGYTTINGACQKCDISCNTCSGSIKKCTECASGYVKNETNEHCYPCSLISNCNACEVVDNLLKCQQGQCKTGFQQTLQENYSEQCVKCPANCQTCLSSKVCALCQSGYAVNTDGKCLSCSSVANCITCAFSAVKNSLVCALGGCVDRFHSQDGVCQPCQANNCLQCVQDQPYQCKQCKNDSIVPYNQVCTACGDVIENCAQCEIQNSEYKCKRCVSPFQLSYDRRRCANCHGILNCKECDPISPDRCSLCNNMYKLENEGRECNAWSQTECAEIIFSPTQGKEICTKCWVNMHLIQTVCYGCKQTSCKRCKPDLTTCLECIDSASYTLGADGICRSNCIDKNCVECPDNTSVCEQCDLGFQVDNGQCIACTPNCNVCNGSPDICEECAGDVLLSQAGKCGQCGELIENCQTCDSINGIANCVECVLPFVLSADHQQCVSGCSLIQNCHECEVDKCFKCKHPYVVSDDGLQCEDTTLNCADFDAEQPACLQCQVGSYLDGVVCRPCRDKFPNCAECNPDKCVTCSEDYLLSEDAQFCATCMGIEFCLSCDAADPNLCAGCEKPKLPSVDGDACYYCTDDSNCRKCTNGATCGECVEGMRPFQDSHCVFADCPEHCDVCSQTKICFLCAAGYYLNGSECVLDRCADRVMGLCLSCVGGYTLNGISCEPAVKRSSIDPLEAIAISTATIGGIVAVGTVVLSVIHRNKLKANGRASAFSATTASTDNTAPASQAAPPAQPKAIAPAAEHAPVRRVVKKKLPPRAMGAALSRPTPVVPI